MNNLKNKKKQHSNLNRQGGFAFSLMSLGVTFILGSIVLWSMNSVSLSTTISTESYSSSQSKYSSVSGIEFTKRWIQTHNLASINGSWNFRNGTISITSSTKDRFGNNLPPWMVRVISTTTVGNSVRRVQAYFSSLNNNFWPDISVIESVKDDGGHGGDDGGGEDDDGDDDDDDDDDGHDGHDGHGHGHESGITMKDNFIFDGVAYFGTDINIDCDNCVGNNSGAYFYRRSGTDINDSGNGNIWSYETVGESFIPPVDFFYEDSLIGIAQAITQTSGNKIKGDYKPNDEEINLTDYEDNTLFVKGKIEFKACNILDCSIAEPCLIIATKDIIIKEIHHEGTTIGDNIIIVSDKNITVERNSQVGVDYSNLDPLQRPLTVNELFVNGDINLHENTQSVWAQLISPAGKVEIDGNCYGVVYAGQGLGFDHHDAYIEGAIFTRELSKPPNGDLKHGRMNLSNHNQNYFLSTIGYDIVPNTIVEY